MIADLSRLHAMLSRRSSVAEPPAEGIVLGHRTDGAPVMWHLPTAEHAAHAVVLGASGSGKSTMIASALVEELAQLGPRGSLILVDAKSDLVKLVLAGIAAQAPERLADVQWLDPFAGGFAFNLCHLDGVDEYDILATQLAGIIGETSTAAGAQRHLGVGARQTDVLVHALLAALTIPDPRAHALLALDALLLPQGLARLALLTTNDRARTFCATARLSDELRASCAARLRTALAPTDRMERLVCAPGCVQLADLLGPGRCTIIALGDPPGGLEILQRFYSNIMLRLIADALMRRPSPCPEFHHVRVVVDEAQVVVPVLADVAERVLTTGRSRNMSLTLMSQTTTLLDEGTLLTVLLANAPHRYVGRLGVVDAERLAREQAPGRGVEETPRVVRDRFMAQVTNLADRAFFHLGPGVREHFTTRDVDIAAWEDAATRCAGSMEEVRRRYALPPSQHPRVTLDDLAPPQARRGRSRTPTRSSAARGNGTRATAARTPVSRWG